MPLVVLRRFDSPAEAELARSALEAAGIDAQLADEAMVGLNWLIANAIGGIKVLVREEDFDRAAGVLEHGVDDVVDVEPEPIEALRCPACGSENVRRVPVFWIFFLLAALAYGAGAALDQRELGLAGVVVAVIIAAVAKTHLCIECGEKWNAEAPEIPPPPPDEFDTIEEKCPRCGSTEYYKIPHRQLKTLPMLIHPLLLAVIALWPFIPKKRCDVCGYEA